MEALLKTKADAAHTAFRMGGMDALMDMYPTAAGVKLPGARWESEAIAAALLCGWEVVAADGNSDYQGWGRLLLRCEDQWATLSWSYGSCGGCDGYEGLPTNDTIESLGADIIVHPDEAKARLVYAEGGW
jgi:hypothetical protein